MNISCGADGEGGLFCLPLLSPKVAVKAEKMTSPFPAHSGNPHLSSKLLSLSKRKTVSPSQMLGDNSISAPATKHTLRNDLPKNEEAQLFYTCFELNQNPPPHHHHHHCLFFLLPAALCLKKLTRVSNPPWNTMLSLLLTTILAVQATGGCLPCMCPVCAPPSEPSRRSGKVLPYVFLFFLSFFLSFPFF